MVASQDNTAPFPKSPLRPLHRNPLPPLRQTHQAQRLHHQCGLAAGGEGVGDEGQANDMRRLHNIDKEKYSKVSCFGERCAGFA